MLWFRKSFIKIINKDAKKVNIYSQIDMSKLIDNVPTIILVI